jgi:hypothetical protein
VLTGFKSTRPDHFSSLSSSSFFPCLTIRAAAGRLFEFI